VKSFHHKKEINKTKLEQKETIPNLDNPLKYKTLLDIEENKENLNKIGQKDVCTLKKGLIIWENLIIKKINNLNNF